MNKKQQFAMGAVASTAALTTYTLNYETDMYKQTPTLYAATTAGCAVIVSAVSAVGYGLYQLALYGKDKMNAAKNQESTAPRSNRNRSVEYSDRKIWTLSPTPAFSRESSMTPAFGRASRSASPQSFAAIQPHSRPAIQGGRSSSVASPAPEGRSSLDRAAKQRHPYSR